MNWVHGLQLAVSVPSIVAILLGSFIGLVIGVLPGLGGVFALTLFLPLTFSLPAVTSLDFLVSLYTATTFGGAITAILINTPGTPGNVATTFDGYPLALQGRAGETIAATGLAGAFGGILSVFVVIFVSPYVANVGIHINPADYFMLAVFGLSMVSVASQGSTLSGLTLGGVGFLISMIGTDPISGNLRLTFGVPYLANNGLQFPVIVVGIFALSNAFLMLEKVMLRQPQSSTRHRGGISLRGGVLAGVKAFVSHPLAVIRSAVVGIVIGAIPGIGISIANVVAYVVESRFDKQQTFGKGNIVGPMAAEAADNGCMPSELIPAFTLGIPGGASSALMLSAIMIHGLQPGPAFFSGNATTSAMFIAMLISQIVFALLGIVFSRLFAKVVDVPQAVLAPIIIVLGCVGAFAVGGRLGDVVMALVFGGIGYVMLKLQLPIAPLVLGVILGPLAESNYRRAMLISSATHFSAFLHPLPILLGLISVAVFAYPILKDLIKKKATEVSSEKLESTP